MIDSFMFTRPPKPKDEQRGLRHRTHGNHGVYLLGQFSGAANLFSSKEKGWLDRPFRHIRSSRLIQRYSGPDKWWSPSHDSTFTPVPEGEHGLFEEHILKPYFGITLSDFGV
jgi:5-methylcytosine-specific restriction protein B